jgi:hypothetical protein
MDRGPCDAARLASPTLRVATAKFSKDIFAVLG